MLASGELDIRDIRSALAKTHRIIVTVFRDVNTDLILDRPEDAYCLEDRDSRYGFDSAYEEYYKLFALDTLNGLIEDNVYNNDNLYLLPGDYCDISESDCLNIQEVTYYLSGSEYLYHNSEIITVTTSALVWSGNGFYLCTLFQERRLGYYTTPPSISWHFDTQTDFVSCVEDTSPILNFDPETWQVSYLGTDTLPGCEETEFTTDGATFVASLQHLLDNLSYALVAVANCTPPCFE